MAKKKAPKGPTQIEAITHKETRANIPTADARDLAGPEVDEVLQVSYPREIRSPMLVWKGKEQLDDEDLQVDAPPIYIQEKIDSRVLIENLRKTAAEGEVEPELTLFDTFDGLSELDLVEFYKHSANWSNRMILGDSLQVMASLAEREMLRGKVQMIYIDPPYGIKFGSNWQVSARKLEVKDGKAEHVVREAEQVKAFRDTWELGIHSYLSYIRDRVVLGRDLLTESGSLFLQIGDENAHLVRSVLDEVLGADNFLAQIAVRKTTGVQSAHLAGTFDYVLVYAKNASSVKYRQLFVSKSEEASRRYDQLLMPDGSTRAMTAAEKSGHDPIPENSKRYRLDNLTSEGAPSSEDERKWDVGGESFFVKTNAHWKTHAEGRERLVSANRVERTSRGGLSYRRFLDDFPVQAISNLWTDISGAEQSRSIGKWYVVQSSRSLLERCISMSTDPGDLVLDPTCGSGTTAAAAELLGRRWITIDSSRVALALARQRVLGARFPYFLLADSVEGRSKEAEITGVNLPAMEPTNDVRKGFVCERVPHIKLGSIANSPDIEAGMSQPDIDAAIARHSEQEMLFDKPYEDQRKVRVTGPFTVESLSPHRNLAGPQAVPVAEIREPFENEPFEQTILQNLRAAGVQNGRKAERLQFDLIEPYAGAHVQAVGVREVIPEGAPKRVGVSIGPQYGTVAPSFVKNAAREASKDKDLDLLCILGFAFDPQVLNSDEDYVATDESFDVAGTRSLGRIPVLLVRMNSDLLMGEELKKTGTGNLFTVFGEPDVAIKQQEDEVVVELLGVDVYDPSTGEVRSDQTDKVALWMIDTDYDEESFFVRHCYFTGGQDPYKRLKKSLNADIDEEAWESLYQTVSRPFPKPSTGKIAVKVINDYGDEVVKVYDLA